MNYSQTVVTVGRAELNSLKTVNIDFTFEPRKIDSEHKE